MHPRMEIACSKGPTIYSDNETDRENTVESMDGHTAELLTVCPTSCQLELTKDFAIISCTQVLQGQHVDVVADEASRTVVQQNLNTAGVS